MPDTKKTHWKKYFNYDYLGAYSLEPGSDLTVTIKKVQKEMVTGRKGKEEECVVCHFTDSEKPMILNRTNCKIIEKVYKTPHVEEWKGKQIQLYSASVDAFGTTTDALRVREFMPDAKHEKTSAELEELKAKVRKLLSNYKSDDADKIKKELNTARENGDLNIAFAKKIIKKIQNGQVDS